MRITHTGGPISLPAIRVDDLMGYKVLGWLRYFVPGILLYVLFAGICSATSWCTLPVPSDVKEFFGLTIVVALAFAYAALGLREKHNNFYFDQVTGNLVHRLTSPFAGDPSVSQNLTWKQIRAAFYNLVNSDEALKHHSQRAFLNGALWTSAADLRVVSLIGILFFELALLVGQLSSSLYFPPHRALVGVLSCLTLFSVSFPISRALTQRQIEIGNEQVEHIMMHHRQAFREKLSQI
jgi:hypothetical protein